MHVFDGYVTLAPGDAAAADEQPHAHAEHAAAEAAANGTTAAPEAALSTLTGTAAAATQSGEPPAAGDTAPPQRPASQGDPLLPPKVSFADRLREGASAARSPSPEGKRLFLCFLLALMLAGQLIYVFRSQVAARYPAMRVLLIQICDYAGCTVTLPQRPDLVKIEASDVNMIDAGKPSLIQLTATLRSYADYDVAYPALDLVLTNANEHALARRIFKPEEYLDQTRDVKAGIAPRAEITLALDLDITDLNAAGFRLDLLAAPSP
jgi:hypothetical protein